MTKPKRSYTTEWFQPLEDNFDKALDALRQKVMEMTTINKLGQPAKIFDDNGNYREYRIVNSIDGSGKYLVTIKGTNYMRGFDTEIDAIKFVRSQK